ncbi:haloacid dehalogenase type II [Pseudonocardia acaciae]|uniref:haloacid dehalogenase type II n=1 Tax=Pseudonocardia acaciae TaxID=551276 RepID=UPI00048D1E75|nr:haloacid dehalogenase type II [Pseudonocardia acaciae]
MTEPTDGVRALAVDIFGTTVDWWTGVTGQVAEVAAERGVALDAGEVADAWRELYLPSMARVNDAARPWAYLDTLHRESLDELLVRFGVDGAFDEPSRRRLVRAWHRLPAWDDVAEGLARLRTRYQVVALSNGGFALLTAMLKAEGLDFDAIISAQNARAYKPDPRAYREAVELLDLAPDRVLMVACHRWDIDGARRAGLRTAFVERPREKGPHRTADLAADTASDVKVGDFVELAAALGC